MVSVSRQYGVPDGTITECRTGGGMRIVGETNLHGENQPQYHSIHQ
jgi:hypothetical protein